MTRSRMASAGNLSPVALVAVLRHRIDAVRRALRGLGLDHRMSFWFLRSPGWQPRCPFGQRCGSSERSKALQRRAVIGGQPAGGSRSVLTANVTSVEPGAVERLLAWRRFSEGYDEHRNRAAGAPTAGLTREHSGARAAGAQAGGIRMKLDARNGAGIDRYAIRLPLPFLFEMPCRVVQSNFARGRKLSFDRFRDLL